MPVIKKAKPMQPARTLCLGFLIIITVGALLLWLPFSSKSGSTSFFDCLFTATSATCVTGLVVVDTYSNWTIFGQAVIALLIQVGGLGFVTIITFFNVAAGKKLGFRTLANVSDGLTESTFQGGRRIFISIIKYSMIFEGAGEAPTNISMQVPSCEKSDRSSIGTELNPAVLAVTLEKNALSSFPPKFISPRAPFHSARR